MLIVYSTLVLFHFHALRIFDNSFYLPRYSSNRDSSILLLLSCFSTFSKFAFLIALNTAFAFLHLRIIRLRSSFFISRTFSFAMPLRYFAVSLVSVRGKTEQDVRGIFVFANLCIGIRASRCRTRSTPLLTRGGGRTGF